MRRKKTLLFCLHFSLWILPSAFQGVCYQHLVTSDPLSIHVLTIDPNQVHIVAARALDMGIGRESVESLARRHHALAGINGGFFAINDTYDGIPRGILKIDHKWYGLPYRPRGAIGWNKDGTVLFDRLLALATVQIQEQSIVIDGLNQPRDDHEAILFSSGFGFTTLTDPGGCEIAIENNTIKKVSDQGSMSIPPNGWVLSLGKERFSDLSKQMLALSDPVSIQIDILPQNCTQTSSTWNLMSDIVGGAPLLIENGQRLTQFEVEKTSLSFLLCPHARTALGLRSDGLWVFVVVDGQQPHFSLGMTIDQLARFMESLDCIYALNLDGGGSSTMVYDSKIVSQPKGGQPPSPEGEGLLKRAWS